MPEFVLVLCASQEDEASKAAERTQDANSARIVPPTAMQERLESPFLAESSRPCSPMSVVSSPLKAGSSADGTPPRKSSERRKVSFSVESKMDGEREGHSGQDVGSPGRAICLQELREVMKQMNYTRYACRTSAYSVLLNRLLMW